MKRTEAVALRGPGVRDDLHHRAVAVAAWVLSGGDARGTIGSLRISYMPPILSL